MFTLHVLLLGRLCTVCSVLSTTVALCEEHCSLRRRCALMIALRMLLAPRFCTQLLVYATAHLWRCYYSNAASTLQHGGLYSLQAYLKMRIRSALLWIVTCAGSRCVTSGGALEVGESAMDVSRSLREFKVEAFASRCELMVDHFVSKAL
jgi:hypothetical protein